MPQNGNQVVEPIRTAGAEIRNHSVRERIEGIEKLYDAGMIKSSWPTIALHLSVGQQICPLSSP
jgi:hypothetical protein